MNRILFLFFLLFSLASFSQNEFFIKDQISLEPIPFVKVIPTNGDAFLADIDGKFTYSPKAVLLLKSPGHKDTLIDLALITDQQILMQPLTREIQEVTVVAGENPAHRIINLVIANRKKNNPLENDSFKYTSYSKFVFTANQEAVDSIPSDTPDTLLQKIKKFFTDQHLFMIESASERTFMPPSYDKEEITAYKISGFSDPMFSTFANEMQSFSFYENQFQLMEKTYLNPIAFGGTKRYLFILEDTTVVGKDTTFTIFYRPRKGKNFDGMTGRLYINTNGYAIEKVTASPYEDTTGMNIQIIQEYAFINDYKWFPSKLSTEMSFKGLTIIPKWKEGYLQGRGSTYIADIQLNPEGIKKKDFDNITISTDVNAGVKSDKDWDSLRFYNITDKEQKTYSAIDSIAKKYNFDKKLRIMNVLMNGKIPLGYFNLDMSRLFDFNLYEGYRLGAGLETSAKMMKNIVIGGYYAYGTKDKMSKYGGYTTFYLNRRQESKIFLRYQNDLIERGGPNFPKEGYSLGSTESIRELYIKQMDRQILGEIGFSKRFNSNFKVQLSGNYQQLSLTEGYLFHPKGDSTEAFNRFDLAETTISIDWNIKEKYMLLGDKLIPDGTKYPRIKLQMTKGWEGLYNSNFDYLRLNLNVSQSISLRGFGKIYWSIAAGQTFGNVPLTLQQAGIGTARAWAISVRNSFETMLPSEFYQSRQAGLFTRIDLNAFKTKADWHEPQIGFHNAFGIGDYLGKEYHSIPVQSIDKGFTETGIVLNNLYMSGYTGIGVGFFYRYGNYADPNWKNNLYPKFAINFSF